MELTIPLDVWQAAVAGLLVEDEAADPMAAGRIASDDWQQSYMQKYICQAAGVMLALHAHNMLST